MLWPAGEHSPDRAERRNVRVSIITIAYNSEAEIRSTIESILGQSYTDMEYLVIDGASKDKTVDIAEGYRKAFKEKRIAYHIFSEPDKGIYDAMNKGILQAKGDIIGIINSGDKYFPDAVRTAVETFQRTDCELMFGNLWIQTNGRVCFEKKARQRRFYQTSRDWNHPTMFVKSELYKRYPFRDLGIHDDYGFYLRMRRQKRKIVTVDKKLAIFALGGASNRKKLKEAVKRIKDRYQFCYRINGYSRLYLIECIGIEVAKWFYT